MSKKQAHIHVRIDEEVKDKFYSIAKNNAKNPSPLLILWILKYIDKNSSLFSINVLTRHHKCVNI